MKDEENSLIVYALWDTNELLWTCSLVHPNVTESFPSLFLTELFIFSKIFSKEILTKFQL